MNISVPSVLPRSSLTPSGLQHKFIQGQTSHEPYLPPINFTMPRSGPPMPMLPGVRFSGLGDCIEWDPDTGDCIASDGSTPTGDSGPGGSYNCPGSPGCPEYTIGSDPTVTGWAGSGVLVPDGSGDVLLPDPSGHGYIEISPSGITTHVNGLPPTPGSGTATSITPSQAQAYASIINSLAQAGVRIAAITSLPAGASLLPNGTIVGAGQTIGPGGQINPTLGSLLSSPVLLLGGAALIIGILAMR